MYGAENLSCDKQATPAPSLNYSGELQHEDGLSTIYSSWLGHIQTCPEIQNITGHAIPSHHKIRTLSFKNLT